MIKENPVSNLAKKLRKIADNIDKDISDNPDCDTKKQIMEFSKYIWPALTFDLTIELHQKIEEIFGRDV